MNDITSLIREAQSMVTMLWLVTARIIDDGKLPRLKAERWGKPYRLRWFLKEWSFQMNWFFIDFKILRSEKIGHAHDKSKCLPDNCCDGSFLYYPYNNGFRIHVAIVQWLRLMCFNFPFAFFTQLFFIQPFVRTVFKLIFAKDIKNRKNF